MLAQHARRGREAIAAAFPTAAARLVAAGRARGAAVSVARAERAARRRDSSSRPGSPRSSCRAARSTAILFCDNVLFENGRVSGIIDFGFAATDAFAYDLAIAVNDWCTSPDAGTRRQARWRSCRRAWSPPTTRVRPLDGGRARAVAGAAARRARSASGCRVSTICICRGRASSLMRTIPPFSNASCASASLAPPRFPDALHDAQRDLRSRSLAVMRADGVSWLAARHSRCSARRRCRGCCCCLPTICWSRSPNSGRGLRSASRRAGAEAGVRRRLSRRGMDTGARRRAATSSTCSAAFAATCCALIPLGVVFLVGMTLALTATTLVDGGELIGMLSGAAAAERSAHGSGRMQMAMLFGAAVRAADAARAVVRAGAGRIQRRRRAAPHSARACAPRSPTGGPSPSTDSTVFAFGGRAARVRTRRSRSCSAMALAGLAGAVRRRALPVRVHRDASTSPTTSSYRDVFHADEPVAA